MTGRKQPMMIFTHSLRHRLNALDGAPERKGPFSK